MTKLNSPAARSAARRRITVLRFKAAAAVMSSTACARCLLPSACLAFANMQGATSH